MTELGKHDIFKKHIETTKRIKYAFNQLRSIDGIDAKFSDQKFIIYIENLGFQARIDFWPYTGWFCGRKPIGNVKGREINNLIKEIKELQQGGRHGPI